MLTLRKLRFSKTKNKVPERNSGPQCFTPSCRSDYPGALKAYLFAAPRKKWLQNVRRQDELLTESLAVREQATLENI